MISCCFNKCFQLEEKIEQKKNEFKHEPWFLAGFNEAEAILRPEIRDRDKDLVSTRTQYCSAFVNILSEYFSNNREKILLKQNSFLGCYYRFKERYFQQNFDLLVDERGSRSSKMKV